MKILAIDTSAESCSVALRVDASLQVRRYPGARQQTAAVLPLVQALLDEAGVTLRALDVIACTLGPGAFTGVRVGVSVAQGLAFGAGLPVIGVSSLAALAQQAVRLTAARYVLPLLDARMGELYAGAYACGEQGLVQAMTPDHLCMPENYCAGLPSLSAAGLLPAVAWTAIGSGWQLPAAAAFAVLPAQVLVGEPDAEDVIALALDAFARGAAIPPEQLLPIYLRDTVTWKKLDQQGKR